MAIDFDTTAYWELNNFSANSVQFEGRLYPTSEHAYQAAKFTDPKLKDEIRAARSPAAAKRLVHHVHESAIDPEWDAGGGLKKLRVMEAILCAKLA